MNDGFPVAPAVSMPSRKGRAVAGSIGAGLLLIGVAMLVVPVQNAAAVPYSMCLKDIQTWLGCVAGWQWPVPFIFAGVGFSILYATVKRGKK